MSFFATCCGFYCALTSAVGIYFYLILAIMELKGNLTLKYIWNTEKPATSGESEPMSELMADPHTKGIAFLILAGIEAAFLIGCLVCANVSKNADEAEEEENLRKAKQREYEPVGMDEQIMS